MKNNLWLNVLRKLLGFIFVFLISYSSQSWANGESRNPSDSSVEYARLSSGQYVIDTYVNGQGPFKFMIDTAASRSSIFEKTKTTLGLEYGEGEERFVSGMINSGLRPIVKIAKLSFAQQKFKDHTVLVLKDWDDLEEPLDGILGLDVFTDLVLHFSKTKKNVRVYKESTLPMSKFRRWDKIKLSSSPYPGKGYGLLFSSANIGRAKVPVLIDSGAGFTMLNWKSLNSKYSDIEKVRLREEWVVQGAIGEFVPTSQVIVKNLKIDGLEIDRQNVLILDFDKFPVNGYGKYPLMVMGIDVFGGRDFVLDFQTNQLLMEPRHMNVNLRARASRVRRY